MYNVMCLVIIDMNTCHNSNTISALFLDNSGFHCLSQVLFRHKSRKLFYLIKIESGKVLCHFYQVCRKPEFKS